MHFRLILLVLASVIYTSLACSPEIDVDYKGIPASNDLYAYPIVTSNYQDCCSRCNADSRCNAWTWVYPGGYCYLKSGVGYKVRSQGRISGLKSSTTSIGRTCSFREYNYAYLYNDISLPQTVSSVDECCTKCGQTSGCVAWTYLGSYRYCYLKNALPTSQQRITYSNAVSGRVD